MSKPKMNLLGEDGNIYAILGRASRLLRQNGQNTQAEQMYFRVTSSQSYDEALHIISEYVETELSKPEPVSTKEENTEESVRKQLLDIAKECMHAIEVRGDLDYRGNDDADFVNVSVGSIEGALRAAYDLGRGVRQRELTEQRTAPKQQAKKREHQHER